MRIEVIIELIRHPPKTDGTWRQLYHFFTSQLYHFFTSVSTSTEQTVAKVRTRRRRGNLMLGGLCAIHRGAVGAASNRSAFNGAYSATGPASAPGLCLGRPARAHAGPPTEDTLANISGFSLFK